MNLELLEKKLARYEPSAPPSDLKDNLVGTALRRVRSRGRACCIIAIAGVIALIGALLNMQAERVYDEGVRFASCASQPPPTKTVVRASVLSLNVPGARALLQWNGDRYE